MQQWSVTLGRLSPFQTKWCSVKANQTWCTHACVYLPIKIVLCCVHCKCAHANFERCRVFVCLFCVHVWVSRMCGVLTLPHISADASTHDRAYAASPHANCQHPCTKGRWNCPHFYLWQGTMAVVEGLWRWQGVFFIHSGFVELRASFLKPTGKTQNQKAQLEYGASFNAVSSGSYFGDVSVLLNTPITATVMANTVAVLYNVHTRCVIPAPTALVIV